jgi:hypothetical protein
MPELAIRTVGMDTSEAAPIEIVGAYNPTLYGECNDYKEEYSDSSSQKSHALPRDPESACQG